MAPSFSFVESVLRGCAAVYLPESRKTAAPRLFYHTPPERKRKIDKPLVSLPIFVFR